MVLCVVHALIVGIQGLTLTRKSFTPTCFIRVSCHTIINVWTRHGEIGVMMEDSEEEEDDDNYVPPEYGDAATGEAEDQEEAEDPEEPDDVPNDDLRRVIVDARS